METLSEAALRMSEGRCGKGCESCPANSIRRGSGSGACLIRRIARIDNAAAQIDFLMRWMTDNPPKPKERTGRWVRHCLVGTVHTPIPVFTCDQCNRAELITTRYCAGCGARMDLREDEDD